jgi:transcriptional regulator with XRE-family HTH domain
MSARTERLLQELTAAIREEVAALPANVLTLGEEVLAARTQARMSLQEVADAAGFTKSHVWEVEKGRARNPTIGMVAGLSKALGVPFLRLAQAALNTAEDREAAPPHTQAMNGEEG